jgi:Carboxypeptidase regulatory-like domain/TonB-dependent Receptor Plug Domain
VKNFIRILLALSFTTFAARAASELTGSVSGYVYDPTGAALSEVPLVISGTALQKPIQRTTGDDGRFTFELLQPAEDYVIEVNVPGFTPTREIGIKVRLGQTTISDVHLTIQTEAAGTTGAAQTYNIVEKVNPVMNPDSAQSVAVITAEKAAQTPLFHQVEGVPQQVAGVGPGNRPSTRGGLARHSQFYVDGLNTTDITTGNITAPMNFDAVENFEIITGGFDAQYNSMGMIENAVTKTGGNEYKVDTSFTFNPTWLSAKNNFPANQPAFFNSFVENPNPAPATSFYSPVFNFSGPLIKDSLWFYASYQQNFSVRENAVNVLGVASNRPTDTTTTLGRFKLTWQPTTKDRVTVGFNLDRNVINNFVGDSSVTDDAESKIHRGGEFALLNYDHNFSDSTLFTLQTGVTFEESDQDPIHSDFITPEHFDIAQRVAEFNADDLSADQAGNYLHESKYRIQFDPSIAWTAKGLGTHQMKAGVQYSWMIDRQVTGVSGNTRYIDFGGVCDPNNLAGTATFCDLKETFSGNQAGGSLVTRAEASNIGAFIQDRWTINRRLTLIPGIRLDVGMLYGDPTANPAHDGTGEKLTNLAGLGPRFSFTYDIWGDRHTLLVGSYGRNNDVGDAFIAQHGNPALTEFTARFNTASNSFTDCSAIPTPTACTITGGLGARSIPYHSLLSPMKPPHVDEFLVGLHHEVIPETVIGVDFDYRYYGNMWEDIETNRIFDSTGTKIVGYQDPTKIGQSVTIATTANEAYRKYESMDLWVQGTPGRWDLLASYTLAYNWGTVSDYFDGFLLNPRMTHFYDGYVPDDHRHTIKGSVSYRTLFGLDIGVRLQYRTGSPLWESFANPADSNQRIYKSPRGTAAPISTVTNAQNFNDPQQFTEIRNPDQFTLDLQARYNLANVLHMKQQRLDLVLLVVNTLNDPEASGLSDSFSVKNSRFGDAFSHFSPLQAEILLRYRN